MAKWHVKCHRQNPHHDDDLLRPLLITYDVEAFCTVSWCHVNISCLLDAIHHHQRARYVSCAAVYTVDELLPANSRLSVFLPLL